MTQPRSKLRAEPFLHSTFHRFLGNDPALSDVFEPALDLLRHVDMILDVFKGSVVGIWSSSKSTSGLAVPILTSDYTVRAAREARAAILGESTTPPSCADRSQTSSPRLYRNP